MVDERVVSVRPGLLARKGALHEREKVRLESERVERAALELLQTLELAQAVTDARDCAGQAGIRARSLVRIKRRERGPQCLRVEEEAAFRFGEQRLRLVFIARAIAQPEPPGQRGGRAPLIAQQLIKQHQVLVPRE